MIDLVGQALLLLALATGLAVIFLGVVYLVAEGIAFLVRER